MNKKNLILTTGILAVLVLLTILAPWQDAMIIKVIRIILGSVFVLFLPGYWLTLSFFGNKEIDRLERFALSFALSISVVPLLTFYVNLIGVKISQLSVWAVIVVIILANWSRLEYGKRIRKLGIRNLPTGRQVGNRLSSGPRSTARGRI